MAEAHLASLRGMDAEEAASHLAAAAVHVSSAVRMNCDFSLWKATRDTSYLRRAHEALDHLCENAPEDDRKTTRHDVRTHREIEEAYQVWRETEPHASAG